MVQKRMNGYTNVGRPKSPVVVAPRGPFDVSDVRHVPGSQQTGADPFVPPN